MKRTFALLMPALLATTFMMTSCSDKNAPDKKDTFDVTSNLQGSYVVPSTSSTATGTMTGTYNKNTKQLTYNINYSGVTPTSITLNESLNGYGTNGPVLATLPGQTGTITLNQVQENELVGRLLYINLPTTANPRGDIRGYIEVKKF